MVVERFRENALQAIHRRFAAEGRMLPPNVTYVDSWVDAAGSTCFQLMEAPDAQALEPWMCRWNDLITFEVVNAVRSPEFWGKFEKET